jgi:hypothetical protein
MKTLPASPSQSTTRRVATVEDAQGRTGSQQKKSELDQVRPELVWEVILAAAVIPPVASR